MKRYQDIVKLGLLALALTAGLSACYKDDSVGPHRTLALATPSEQMAENYDVIYGRELVIAAPKVTLPAGTSAELHYEWSIDYKVVSKEATLRYTPSSYGTLPARLRIYTEDGAYTQQFKVRVLSPYSQGLFVLSGDQSKGYVSYFPKGEQADFEQDVFAKNNPSHSALPAAPIALHFFTGGPSASNQVYATLAFGSPSRAYRLHANRMQVDAPVINFGSQTVGSMALVPYPEFTEAYITGGSLYRLARESDVLPVRDQDQALRRALSSGATISLASVATSWVDGTSRVGIVRDQTTGKLGPVYRTARAAGLILFNAATSELLVNSMSASSSSIVYKRVLVPSLGSQPDVRNLWLQFAENPFQGATMLSMQHTDDNHNVVLLYRTSSGDHKLLLLHPADYFAETVVGAGTEQPRAVQAVYPSLNPVSYKQSETPTKAISYDGARAFVAAGSKVYFYNLQTGSSTDYLAGIATGSKPTSGETIVDILQPDARRLYVAANDGTKGYVYCYDVSAVTPQLLWKSSAFSVPITGLSYRAN